MICSRCQHEIDENLNYCPYCGMQIKKCPVCHRPLALQARFCSHCGTNLEKTPDYSQKEGHYEPLTSQHLESSQYAQKGGYYEPLASHQEYADGQKTISFQDIEVNKKVNKKVIILSVMALIIVTIVSYSYIYYGPDLTQYLASSSTPSFEYEELSIHGDNSSSTHISNINQGGEVYLTEGKVYICDDQGYLISMDRNLENRETVIQEKCQYVTVTKDAIYFTDENMNICKTTLTGANKEVLVKTKAYYVTVIDEYIYYQSDTDSERLYVYDMKTKENKKLNDRRTYCINVVDDMIYYSSDDGVYQIGKNGQGEEKLLSEIGVCLVYQDDKLYYLLNDGTMVYYDLDKKELQDIATDGYRFIGLTGQYLFYYNTQGQVVRYNLKIESPKVIYNGYINEGYIIGDTLVLNCSQYNQQDQPYKIIMDKDGKNQQRLFSLQNGDFV